MHIVRQRGLTSYMWRSSVKNTATMSQCMTRTHTNTLTNVNTHFREDVSTQGQDIKVCFVEQLKEIRLMSACVRMNSSWHCSYLAGLRVSCSNSACVCWGLRRWRESVCVCALFLSEPKIFMNPHLCKRLEKVCVCACVCPILLFHTLCSLKHSLGLFSSILLSFIFPPWDGKLLLSLVQLMLRAHATESPDTFLYISLWVWHGPWHRSDLRRLSDSSGSTVRASSSPLVTTLSFICCRKTSKKQQKKMTVCVRVCGAGLPQWWRSIQYEVK